MAAEASPDPELPTEACSPARPCDKDSEFPPVFGRGAAKDEGSLRRVVLRPTPPPRKPHLSLIPPPPVPKSTAAATSSLNAPAGAPEELELEPEPPTLPESVQSPKEDDTFVSMLNQVNK